MIRKNLYYNYISHPNYYEDGGLVGRPNGMSLIPIEKDVITPQDAVNSNTGNEGGDNKFLNFMNNSGSGGWAAAIAPAATNMVNALTNTEASTAERVATAMGIPALAKIWTADTTAGNANLKAVQSNIDNFAKQNLIQDASSTFGANNAVKLNNKFIAPVPMTGVKDLSWKDFRGNMFTKGAAATLQGAASGSVGGPWGALGGAIVGLGSSLFGGIGAKRRAKKAYTDYQNKMATLTSQASSMYKQALNNQTLSNMQALANGNIQQRISDMSNIRAMGGNLYTDLSPNMMSLWNNKQQIDQQKANMQQINFELGNSFNYKNIFPNGGQMNSSDLPDNMQYYANGGTHEENPYGGIQVGTDQQGNPNLVEEGEFRWGDYIFSDRINVDPTLLSRYNLTPANRHQGKKANKGKLSYADMAEKYAKKNKELANDQIGKNTLDAYMKRLQDAQEDQKFQDQMEQQKQDAINQYRNALTTPSQGNPMYGAMKYNGMGNAATQQGINAGMSDLGQQGDGNEVLSNTNRSGNNMLHALGGNLYWKGSFLKKDLPPYGDPNSRIDYAMSYTGSPIIPNGNSRIDYANQFLQGNQLTNDYGVSDFMNRIYSGNVGSGSPKTFTFPAVQDPVTFDNWYMMQHENGKSPYVGNVNGLGERVGGATTDIINNGNGQNSVGYNTTTDTERQNLTGNLGGNTGSVNNTNNQTDRTTTTTFGTAAVKEDPKQVPHYSTAGEYAMFGKGFTPMIWDWMNKTNTKYDPNQRPANELARMGNESTFLRTADTIGGYRAPNLMDVERLNNAAQANSLAALQSAMNVANGNRGFVAAMAQQQAYNAGMNIGNNYATAQQANNTERLQTDQFNNNINVANQNAINAMRQDNQKAQQVGQNMAIDAKKAANDYILRNELYADATNRQAMDNRAANQATWTDNALNYFIAQAQKNDILNAKNNDITNPYWTDKDGVMHYIGDSGLNSAIYTAFTDGSKEWGNYAVNNGTFSGDRLKAWNALQEKYSAADLKAHPELWKSLVLQEKQARKEEADKADKAKSERVANARYAFDNNMAQLNNYRAIYGDKFTNSQYYDDLMKRYNDKANATEFNDINNLEYWNRIMGDEIDYWRRYNTPVTANQSAYGGYINNNNKSNKREYYNYMRR